MTESPVSVITVPCDATPRIRSRRRSTPATIDRVTDTSDQHAPGPRVLGPTVDDETRCIHYRTPLDVVAIKFECCREYYPCHACHAETAGHDATTWPRDARGERALLCGVCRHELTIDAYLGRDDCPACGAAFNPNCARHRHLYFAD